MKKMRILFFLLLLCFTSAVIAQNKQITGKVINKETGELCFHEPEDLDKPNMSQHIKDLKHKLDLSKPPELCYPPVAEGKSGNMRIAKNCAYCSHKKECHKDSNNGKGLRAFRYAKGLVYFTKVRVQPKVDEIHEW